MPSTIVADLDQYLENGEFPSNLSTPALKLARHLVSIVAWVTSHPCVGAQRTNVACRCSPGRRPCPGDVSARHDRISDYIFWECPVCGECGAIGGWRDTQWDHGMALSAPSKAGEDPEPAPPPPRRTTVTITFTASEMELLGQSAFDYTLVDRLVALPGGREWSGTYSIEEIEVLGEDVTLAASGAEVTMMRKKLEALSDRLVLIQSASKTSSWHERGN